MDTPPIVTVLGHTGFIGSHLTEELRRRGVAVLTPGRDDDLAGRYLGTVFYCVGVTADFRSRPFDTVEAHVGKLARVLSTGEFQRLVYLSSTRLYRAAEGPARESDPIVIRPDGPDDLYNASKALGESLALHCGKPCTVVRLSNVYGADFASENFLPSVIKAALRDGKVVLRTALASAKDYVHVGDVVRMLLRAGEGGRERVYNLAAGQNTTHREIGEALRALTGCHITVAPGAAAISFPAIDITRLRDEFDHTPASVLDDLPALVDLYRRQRDKWR